MTVIDRHNQYPRADAFAMRQPFPLFVYFLFCSTDCIICGYNRIAHLSLLSLIKLCYSGKNEAANALYGNFCLNFGGGCIGFWAEVHGSSNTAYNMIKRQTCLNIILNCTKEAVSIRKLTFGIAAYTNNGITESLVADKKEDAAAANAAAAAAAAAGGGMY